MRRLALLLAILATIIVAIPQPTAFAVEPGEALSDPKLEARARALFRQLRCMVCQNQSIDDSDAPLARDLRVIVRERIAAGDTDAQVIDFLVARYGEFVLLRPRLRWGTAVLWGAPVGLLVIGGLVVLLTLRRRRTVAPTPALAAEEEKRLREIVG